MKFLRNNDKKLNVAAVVVIIFVNSVLGQTNANRPKVVQTQIK
jgi:hypothetical protein